MAAMVRAAMDRPVTFIAGTQVGITLASLVLGLIGEQTMVSLLDPLFRSLPLIESLTPPQLLAFVIGSLGFLIITFFHILIGETVPKSIAIYRTERVATLTVPPVLFFSRIARPLIWLVNLSAETLLGAFGLHSSAGRHTVHSEEEIRAVIAESRQAGIVRPEEEELVRRVFRFGDRVAREVMVPRTRVTGVPAQASLEEVVAAVR